ncbi:PIG-L family deacetylase [Isoptericola sp. b441]|uniref:PIG-L family deacetylase n=1 Tax=Actinotalea lenta TaxID=3064654 RepID=A0ABT9DAL1_9CELL|nr:PIG-L family deacetylase [Isoptericola sp. b441]MDO8107945.1 PIG-L family deacetylase [Isoptericola sp. b441]
MGERPRRTIVSFHAHPDDEALLTAGTLAALAAAGHRTVLVTATAGEQGLADPRLGTGAELAERRARELADAARAMGCARHEILGYLDSGIDGAASGRDGFAHVDVEPAAERLAAVLRREEADVLTVYDPAGGYGHPDHLQVHRVGIRAARLAGTPLVLEATVDPRVLLAGTPWFPLLPGGVRRRPGPEPDRTTLRVDVRAFVPAKRAAIAAHRSQLRPGLRTLRALLALPSPVFAAVLGREWFIHRGHEGQEILDGLLEAVSSPLAALDGAGLRLPEPR